MIPTRINETVRLWKNCVEGAFRDAGAHLRTDIEWDRFHEGRGLRIRMFGYLENPFETSWERRGLVLNSTVTFSDAGVECGLEACSPFEDERRNGTLRKTILGHFAKISDWRVGAES